MDELSTVSRIGFIQLCKEIIDQFTKIETNRKKRSLIHDDTVSSFAKKLDNYVMNLSNLILKKSQKEALSVAIQFCFPPKIISPILIETPFKARNDQLKYLVLTSEDDASWF